MGLWGYFRPKKKKENTSPDKDKSVYNVCAMIMNLDKNISPCSVEIWGLPEGPVHMLCMCIHVSLLFSGASILKVEQHHPSVLKIDHCIF